MNLTRYIYVAASFLALCCASCDDDDVESGDFAEYPAIEAPRLLLEEATHNSLSFRWATPAGAVQYGYEFKDSGGKVLEGGMQTTTSISFENLKVLTPYTFTLYAFPAAGNGKAYSQSTKEANTTFYPAINGEGTYKSGFNGRTRTAQIIETRTTPNSFGEFVIKAFYGVEGNDLSFTVNDDMSLTITNGTYDEETGYTLVPTGVKSPPQVKNGVYVKGAESLFSPQDKKITFSVKATQGTAEKEDTFTY